MCGICGLLEYQGPVDRDILARMNNSLRHRGPDDEQYHVVDAPGRGVSVGLGFRRLAIIDVKSGAQPMCNEDGSVWIVFNGEIYNFADLRPQLEARGHVFRTHCDTEVILHLYEEHGPDALTRLNGMFGLAIWDARQQSLLLARDRLGKKPIYYADTGKQFLFGSEVKALLQHPACPRALDRSALHKYLAYEYVPSPHCIFQGVSKLPAGHYLLWKDGRYDVQRYWDLSFAKPGPQRSEAEYADQLVQRLQESVRLRLMSDVPLGVFLSGGLDSSSVVAMMAALLPPSQIKTFSIGFEDKSFDESAHARAVARHFGTDHHEQILSPRAMPDILPEVASYLDEPFADASIVPTYLLSRFARQSVTVALGGDGGDELLAGYPTFLADRAARWYRMPGVLHRQVIEPLAQWLPVSTKNFSADFKIKRFLMGVQHPAPLRHQLWLGSFGPAEQAALLPGDPCDDPYSDMESVLAGCDSRNPLERLIYQYVKFYLQDGILTKTDRASMACSLEVRAPFLDYTFVEFLAAIPARLKLKGTTTKYILKKAMEAKLPPGIARRKKKGFGIPVAQWIKTDLRDLVSEAFSERRLRDDGIFEPAVVRKLLHDHLAGSKDNRKQLWTLLMFQLWHERYLKSG